MPNEQITLSRIASTARNHGSEGLARFGQALPSKESSALPLRPAASANWPPLDFGSDA